MSDIDMSGINISEYPTKEQDDFARQIAQVKLLVRALPGLMEMADLPKIKNMALYNPDSRLLRELKEQITGEIDHDPFLTGLSNLMFDKREEWLSDMIDPLCLITEADDYYCDEFFYVALFFMRRGVLMHEKYGAQWIGRIVEGRKVKNPDTYKPLQVEKDKAVMVMF